jgi:hypothetical protein
MHCNPVVTSVLCDMWSIVGIWRSVNRLYRMLMSMDTTQINWIFVIWEGQSSEQFCFRTKTFNNFECFLSVCCDVDLDVWRRVVWGMLRRLRILPSSPSSSRRELQKVFVPTRCWSNMFESWRSHFKHLLILLSYAVKQRLFVRREASY